MTSPALLDVRNLSVSTDEKLLVRDVSFTLEKGRTLALIGESGSGKSLTAMSVMGLLPGALHLGVNSAIRFDGTALPLGDDRAMRALRGRNLAIVFQDPMACLNPFMRIGRQIEEMLARLGPSGRNERRRRVEALLDEVELPDPALARRYPHELSGGQQQRVMIAMALSGEPDLLIADEPTSALDASIETEIVRLLAGIQHRRQMAMLFITHDLAVASALAHDIAVMRQGELVEVGSAARILAAPRHPYTQHLVGARRALHAPAEPRAGTPPAPEPPLVVDGLCLDYPARSVFQAPTRIVTDVSLTLQSERVLGILGESGSGKSTLAAAITGLHRPAAGRVGILGHDLTPAAPRLPKHLRRRCQLVFQNPYGALNPRLSIERLMSEPLALAAVPAHEHRPRIAHALEEVGLGREHMARYPHQLSGGQRQRVCIARALLCDPSLLVCDEVVSALDSTVQMQVLKLLKRLQAEHGFTMVFISHDVEVVRWISDEIAVMYRGRIVDWFETPAMRNVDRHAYTKQLVSARAETIAA